MFYGIVTQTQGTYTERQLRAYPQASQRMQDGAQVIPASRVCITFRRLLRTPHVSHLLAGGIRATIITKAQADSLLAS